MSIFLTNKKPIKLMSATHADWLNNRRGIGSSDIATLMGCNKYSSPYKLWLKLRDKNQVEEESFLMKMGHKLEPVVASLWEEERRRKIIPCSAQEYMYVHPEYDYFRASPDREFRYKRSKGILECKTTQMEVSQEELPEYWFCQVQWQMGIGQMEYCNIAWLISGRDFGYAEVNFNPDFFAYMVETAKKFWVDNIIGGIEPELTTAEDVTIKYRHSVSKEIEADEIMLSVYSELKEIQAEQKNLDERKKALSDKIKLYMGENDTLTYEGQRLATYKSCKDKLVLDADSFKRDKPDLYEKYLIKKAGARPLLLK